LGIAGEVKDVASIHKTLWPDETANKPILNIGTLTGKIRSTMPRPAKYFAPEFLKTVYAAVLFTVVS
jgi:hypothetical protein